MTGHAITSYAILEVNWNQPERRDYLDNFVLIVAEAIRQLPDDTITLANVQDQIRRTFGLDLPQNTIKSLLNRVKKRGYIKQDNGIFRRNEEALEQLNFHEIQQRVMQSHEILIEDLVKFALARFSLVWSNEQADEALQIYLQQSQVRLLNELFKPKLDQIPIPLTEATPQIQYVIGAYIQQLQESQSTKLEYLETIIKGNLLANAVFMTDPGTYQRKFKNTAVIIDAPLIIYALGYAGEPRKLPAIELIELLKKHGAQLQIFRHSFNEIVEILTACAERIRSKQYRDSYGPSIEYFIEKGYSETDVMMFIQNLETNLARLGVSVRDKPPYSEHEHVIDEESYMQYLNQQILYRRQTALERDKDSIAAIVRLRRELTFVAIENCRAVFVTANNALAYSTRQFAAFDFQIGTIPLALTDYEMTTLVWLKDPIAAPTLPRKRLIADCFAATRPNERLWARYLDAIDRLEREKQITGDQYFLLRHSIQAKSELMDHTLGDEAAFSEGTVSEILAIVEGRIRAGEVERVNAESVAKQEVLLQLEQERAARLEMEAEKEREEKERQDRINHRARRISTVILLLPCIIAAIIVGYLTYAISSIGPLNIDPTSGGPNTLRTLGIIISWLLIILQTINLIFGFMPKMLLDRLEPQITQRIENWLAMK